MSKQKRYCVRNGERVSVSDLCVDDIAVMYEPDGTPCDNGVSFVVCREPYVRLDGVCVVETMTIVGPVESR